MPLPKDNQQIYQQGQSVPFRTFISSEFSRSVTSPVESPTTTSRDLHIWRSCRECLENLVISKKSAECNVIFLLSSVHHLFYCFYQLSLLHRVSWSDCLLQTRSSVESLWGIGALSMTIYRQKPSEVKGKPVYHHQRPKNPKTQISASTSSCFPFGTSWCASVKASAPFPSLKTWKHSGHFSGNFWVFGASGRCWNDLARCHGLCSSAVDFSCLLWRANGHNADEEVNTPAVRPWKQTRNSSWKSATSATILLHWIPDWKSLPSPKSLPAKNIPFSGLNKVAYVALCRFLQTAPHFRVAISEDPNMMSVISPKDLAAFLTNLTSLFEKEYDHDNTRITMQVWTLNTEL